MKKLAGIIFGTALAISTTITSLAGTWIQDSNGWWYQNDDGSYPVDEWTVIDGTTYHFDANGYMDVDGDNINSSSDEASNSVLKIGTYQSTITTDMLTGKIAFLENTVSVTQADSSSIIVDGTTYTNQKDTLYTEGSISNGLNHVVTVISQTEFTECWMAGNKVTLGTIYKYVE